MNIAENTPSGTRVTIVVYYKSTTQAKALSCKLQALGWSSRCSDQKRHFLFFQAENGIRDYKVTGVQTCALPIYLREAGPGLGRTARSAAPRGYAPVLPVESRDQAADDEGLSLEVLREAKMQAEAASQDRKSVV